MPEIPYNKLTYVNDLNESETFRNNEVIFE